MPAAVPLLVGASVATGTAAEIGTAIAGAAISSAVATGIGAAVIGGVTALATGSEPKDALKTAVIGGLTAGVGSTLGSAAAGIGASDAAFVAADAAQLAGQGLSQSAITQNLVASGVSSSAAQTAAALALGGAAESAIAQQLGSAPLFTARTSPALISQDLDFVGADAEQLYKQTGNVAAVQQNLISAGVDPIIAAEASNLAAMGGTGASIATGLGQAFPGQPIFTSQGLLAQGSTLDPVAKQVAGISSTPQTSVTDMLRLANQARGLLGAGQNPITQAGQLRQQQPRTAGVDYSGVLGLLQQQPAIPNVAQFTQPAQLQPRYQPTLLPNIMSLLG
jgi:hypothetical protein